MSRTIGKTGQDIKAIPEADIGNCRIERFLLSKSRSFGSEGPMTHRLISPIPPRALNYQHTRGLANPLEDTVQGIEACIVDDQPTGAAFLVIDAHLRSKTLSEIVFDPLQIRIPASR